MPEGTLISPVIECGPHSVTLLKPVEITVPHDLCLDEVRKDSIRVYRCEPSSKGNCKSLCKGTCEKIAFTHRWGGTGGLYNPEPIGVLNLGGTDQTIYMDIMADLIYRTISSPQEGKQFIRAWGTGTLS